MSWIDLMYDVELKRTASTVIVTVDIVSLNWKIEKVYYMDIPRPRFGVVRGLSR